MIRIKSITYTNENGELININFDGTEADYCIDRCTELIREMASGGRDLGPPPRPKAEGEMPWMG